MLNLHDINFATVRRHIRNIKAKEGALEDNLTQAFASMYVAGWNHDFQSSEELILKDKSDE